MVAILDLAATTTLAGLRHTRALAEGRGLSRERPSGHAEGHAKSQDERRDQQRYTLLHLISPPFAHSPQHHRPHERRMEGEGTRYKAPPLSLCRWWGSLFRALSVVTPPPFGSPATSLEEERPMGFAPPPRGGFAFIAAPERQSAREQSY